MKKILFLLVLLMGMTCSVWAYDFSATAPSGQTLYYTIDGSNVTVTSENSSSPYYNTYPIGDLVIPDSVIYNGNTYWVTAIGSNAFNGCEGLTTVTIPGTVITIGGSAFNGCTGLTSMTIPEAVTAIGMGSFYNCTGLTTLYFNSINMNDWGTNISSPFYSSSLTTIIIGYWNYLCNNRSFCNFYWQVCI